MAIYFVILILILLPRLFKPMTSQKSRKAYCIYAFTIFLAWLCLRNVTVGVDQHYYNNYPLFGNLSWQYVLSGDFNWYEVGFQVWCKLLNYISSDPQLLIVATGIVSLVPVGVFIYRNCDDVVLGCVCCWCLPIVTQWASMLRQAMAVAIVLIAFEYLKNKKNVRYLILIGFAFLFHKSAIIALLLPFINNGFILKHKKLLIGFACLLPILFLNATPIYTAIITSPITSLVYGDVAEQYEIGGRYAIGDYIGLNLDGSVSGVGASGGLVSALTGVVYVLLAVFVYAIKIKRDQPIFGIAIIKRKNEKILSSENLFIMCLLVYAVCLIFSMFVSNFLRFSFFFLPFTICCFANMAQRNRFARAGVWFMVIAPFALRLILLNSAPGSVNYPYEFFWQ